MANVTMKGIREGWKKETKGKELSSVISGMFSAEKKVADLFGIAIKLVVSSAVGSVGGLDKLVEKANNSAMKTEYNNRLASAKNVVETSQVELDFIHQKDTAQHKKGTFKTSVLPNAWRTSVSTLRGAIELKIALTESVYKVDGVGKPVIVDGKPVIVDYRPRRKSELSGIIAAERKRIEEKDTDTTKGTPDSTSEVSEGGSNTIDLTELTPMAKLEVLMASAKAVIRELPPEEVLLAKAMIDGIWDLSPIAVAVAV